MASGCATVARLVKKHEKKYNNKNRRFMGKRFFLFGNVTAFCVLGEKKIAMRSVLSFSARRSALHFSFATWNRARHKHYIIWQASDQGHGFFTLLRMNFGKDFGEQLYLSTYYINVIKKSAPQRIWFDLKEKK